LNKWFNHQIVNHRIKQYVNGEATTNRIENPWGHLKGTIRTYTHISRKHLQKYLDEFTMRYNTRKYKEQERFDLVLSSTIDKRLTYQELTN
jgi:transposase-like protein